MNDVVLVNNRNDAVWLTINRPEARNALSGEVLRELQEKVVEAGRNNEVRAVIITGSGDKAFSAGADLKERKGMSEEQTRARVDLIGAAFTAIAKIPRPTIALMNGSAYGGGLELAIACDFRIAADDVEMGLTEVRLGIMPGAGGTQRLPRLIGVARAKEMIMLGRRISAQTAASIGLLSRMVPRTELVDSVDSLLKELSGCAPISVTRAKHAIDRGMDVVLEEGLRIERDCYDVTLSTEDRNEGLKSFEEKRTPVYQGK